MINDSIEDVHDRDTPDKLHTPGDLADRAQFTRPEFDYAAHPEGPEMNAVGDERVFTAGTPRRSDPARLDAGRADDGLLIKPSDNKPGQMVEAGHGFRVEVSPRVKRPWKEPTVANCAVCGVRRGPGGGLPVRVRRRGRRGLPVLGVRGHESVRERELRGKGRQRKTCPGDCARSWNNARTRWKRACAKAEKLGTEPPPEPSPAPRVPTEAELCLGRIATEIADARDEFRKRNGLPRWHEIYPIRFNAPDQDGYVTNTGKDWRNPWGVARI